jgi:hypothetical protein
MLDAPSDIATVLCWHTGYTVAHSGQYFTPPSSACVGVEIMALAALDLLQ